MQPRITHRTALAHCMQQRQCHAQTASVQELPPSQVAGSSCCGAALQAELKQWAEASQQREEESLALAAAKHQDEKRVRELTHKLERCAQQPARNEALASRAVWPRRHSLPVTWHARQFTDGG